MQIFMCVYIYVLCIVYIQLHDITLHNEYKHVHIFILCINHQYCGSIIVPCTLFTLHCTTLYSNIIAKYQVGEMCNGLGVL